MFSIYPQLSPETSKMHFAFIFSRDIFTIEIEIKQSSQGQVWFVNKKGDVVIDESS